MEKQLNIYTKYYCPYCNVLKNFLKEKEIPFTEIEVSDKPSVHREVIQKTGHRTVPAVFVGEQFIGGSEDFYEWYSQNS